VRTGNLVPRVSLLPSPPPPPPHTAVGGGGRNKRGNGDKRGENKEKGGLGNWKKEASTRNNTAFASEIEKAKKKGNEKDWGYLARGWQLGVKKSHLSTM